MKFKFIPRKDVLLLFMFLVSMSMMKVTSQDVDIVFPSDAGVVDVTKAPYNIDSTGATDVTVALQAIIDEWSGRNSIVYLPKGKYLISNTLYWGPSNDLDANLHKRLILQGQNRNQSTIILADNATGFGDAGSPKEVIWTGKAPAQNFRNSIRNLTINTGSGNPGAMGAHFFASNQGTMRHVNIISGDGAGAVGLDLTGENGPLYVFDVYIEGFDIGILGNAVDGLVLEKIHLKDQNTFGIHNINTAFSMRNLLSENSVQAVYNEGGDMALIDAQLNNGSGSVAAIRNTNNLFARNITTSGYSQAIDNSGGNGNDVTGSSVVEFSSHDVLSLFATSEKSLNLPIEELPHVEWHDTTEWGNPVDYGAVLDKVTDDGPAIQAAIDAGYKTVYLKRSFNWTLESDVYIRGNTQRIIGCETGIKQGSGRFIITDDAPDTVWIERIDGLGGDLTIVNYSSKVVVISSISDMDIEMYGSGKLFIADVVTQLTVDNEYANVWARQIDGELDQHTIVNKRGTIWILGYKTETSHSGDNNGEIRWMLHPDTRTEILGGFVYNVRRSPLVEVPVAEVNNAFFTVAGIKYSHSISPPNHYTYWVRESQNGEVKTLGISNSLPLYVSEASKYNSAPQAPQALSAQGVSYNQIDLVWGNIDNATKFKIERKEGSGGTYALIDSVGLNDTTYNDKTLEPNKTYYYRVYASNFTSGDSPASSEVSATTQGCASPAKPMNGAAEGISAEQMLISWDAQSVYTQDGFIVERKKTGESFVVVDTVYEELSSYIDAGLSTTTEYIYRLKSITTHCGNSEYSDEFTGMTTGLGPGSLFWKFDETSGTIAGDASGNGNNGELIRGIDFSTHSVEGKNGKALDFSGIDANVRCDADFLEGYPFTLNVWVKTTSGGSVMCFSDRKTYNNYFRIGVSGGGYATLSFREENDDTGNWCSSTMTINDDTWHMVSMVFLNDTVKKMYIDGVYDTIARQKGSISENINTFAVGVVDRGSPISYFGGIIDEVSFYNYALEDSDILSLYNGLSTFLISVNANDGGVVDPNKNSWIQKNGSQTFNFSADENHWVDDVLVDGNSVGKVQTYTFTDVTNHHSLEVIFDIEKFTIAASAGDNGSIFPEGDVLVPIEYDAFFVITPEDDYGIKDVIVDGASVGPTDTVWFNTVTEDHTIEAVFGLKYIVKAIAGANGAISPEGDVTVIEGEDYTFTFTPDNGYRVNEVVLDGDVVAVDTNQYTLENISGPHTIAVTFTEDKGSSIAGIDLEKLALYPNPYTNGKLVIHGLGSVQSSHINVYINDVTGKTVYSLEASTFSENGNIEISDLSGLKAGLYMVRLEAGNAQLITKLIVR